jgi:putative ABC transport system permease protein
MSELFGLSMNTIMVVMLALLAACLAVFAWVFLANRSMFRMGLRNIPRRRAQSALIVTGLMLATVIITAAFTTGDVIDYSATKATYDNLGRTDLSLHHFRPLAGDVPFGETYAPESATAGFEAAFADDPDIEGFVPFLFEGLPVLNPRTRLSEPTVIMAGFDAVRLARFGGLRAASGESPDLAALGEDEVLLGREIAGKLDARTGDTVMVFAQGQPVPLLVAGIVQDERASGTLEFGPGGGAPGMAARLATVQRLTGRAGALSTINVVLRGGVRGSVGRTDAAATRLESFEDDEAAKARIGLEGVSFQVERIKQEAVDGSKETASVFTSLFLVLGLFSIAAGAMLIFTLFVMLAAERRTEMGIARAVGAQRTQIVQAFIAEGFVYDLLAGVAGVAVGVAAALVLVVGGARLLIGDSLSIITAHVEPRSVVVSFCLGAVLTFVTVVFSSFRISHLEIVAAVRGQGGGAARRPARRRTRWLWVVLGVPALAIPPLGFYLLVRKGLGVPWSRVAGPGGLAAGVLFATLGALSHVAFPFTLGVSLLILSAGAIARYYRARPAAAWSLSGLVLAVYWLLPFDFAGAIFGEFEETGMEMFVLSGIMIVTGLTLVIVYNAGLLTRLFAARGSGARRYRASAVLAGLALCALAIGLALGDSFSGLGELGYLVAVFLAVFAASAAAAARFAWLAPALKMGVAYPLANRFRTGMTIAMFSLVVFAITVMGIIVASSLAFYSSDEARGGWDVVAATNDNNPIPDFTAALGAAGFDTSVIAATGRMTTFDDNAQEARDPGGEWIAYPVRAGDEAFFRNAQMKLEGRAGGYEDDREVFDAVLRTDGLALLDAAAVQPSQGFGETLLRVDGVTISEGRFEAFPVEVRDRVTGRAREVTVVGILSSRIPAGLLGGVLMNEGTYRAVLGQPDYSAVWIRLPEGVDDRPVTKSIKAALVTSGVQAYSLTEEIDQGLAESMGLMRIFQAFMGLGLFVGIAGLGVIALRSVVERRQQIGMLRAIGYQRGAVAMSFLLESGFIAGMGILSGVIGASVLSWRMITDDISTNATGIEFFIPWFDIALIVVLTFGFALLMTWWPSRRAASVPVADALRYE